MEITAQTKAANAEFLLRATPPTTPAAICLVDTGVNANPDTANVFSRLSLYGLDGTDASPSLHGTQMAMLMGAPSNGFGMVGLWPAARIVSVQANDPGQDAAIPDAYSTGIDECATRSMTDQVRVIVVTFATEVPLTSPERAFLNDAVKRARELGVNVVIAGGNLNGRPIGAPADAPGAISVGALDATTGSLCATSATGTTLLAPGCSIDGALPNSGAPTTSQQGTSAAAVFVAVGLAALRTWRPDLTVAAAEELIVNAAVPVASGRRLDAAATFTAAGLGGVAQPPVPTPTVAPSPVPTATPGPKKPKLVKPRATARLRGRVLTVRSINRPAKARMRVTVYARDSKKRTRRIARKTVQASSVRVRVQRWSRVEVQFSDPTGARLASSTTTVVRR
ncbi:S8 family serine peptidase [Solirubrobacter phytolaccae]|uniref:S8 family serine peptidase n=1 Tax=Solirubrobacter phytolaccae TaxID=1404360 RepID=A0A9X3N7S5_9ACTN|nr:S8/S53 family peptidase [Solirubrobacter phytolaccae]MDA0181313.1 S8 family serine peptidase [Solirubrobacter phytolaccae]